jgi:hypothetical protein
MASTHNPTTFTTPTAGIRRLAHAALLAGALALGASAFGHTAIASAEWDIEAYDKCVGTPHKEDPQQSYHVYCCLGSGGVWDDNSNTCRAPVDLSAGLGTPLGPKLGQPSRQPVPPPTTTLGAPVS